MVIRATQMTPHRVVNTAAGCAKAAMHDISHASHCRSPLRYLLREYSPLTSASTVPSQALYLYRWDTDSPHSLW
jgi:hypothetical protein